jgi:hypothetical protein
MFSPTAQVETSSVSDDNCIAKRIDAILGVTPGWVELAVEGASLSACGEGELTNAGLSWGHLRRCESSLLLCLRVADTPFVVFRVLKKSLDRTGAISTSPAAPSASADLGSNLHYHLQAVLSDSSIYVRSTSSSSRLLPALYSHAAGLFRRTPSRLRLSRQRFGRSPRTKRCEGSLFALQVSITNASHLCQSSCTDTHSTASP